MRTVLMGYVKEFQRNSELGKRSVKEMSRNFFLSNYYL